MCSNLYDSEIVELDDSQINEIVEKGHEILAELVPVARENDNINIEDIDEYNMMGEKELCYQAVVYPPSYNWAERYDDIPDNLDSDYVEVVFAYLNDSNSEPAPTDKVFAVLLLSRDLKGEDSFIAVEWLPVDYELD
jgi:hypothetical protein